MLLATVIAVIVGNSALIYAPLKRRKQQERLESARELEIKVRMAKGVEVIDDLRTLAEVYRQSQRFEEAEGYLRQALFIGEREYGSESSMLVPVLNDYAKILKSMRRTAESAKIRARSRQLAEAKNQP